MIIRRIEHLADNLSHCLFFHSANIIALIKHRHINAVNLCRPKAEHRGALAVLTGYHHIIGNRLNGFAADKLNMVERALPVVGNLTLKLNFNGFILSGNKPYLSAGKPEIGHLGLPAVNNLLLENAVFIKNRIAHSVVALICQSVKIAGGKSAETAVSETCVRLAVIKLLELYSEFRKSLLCRFGQIEVIERVFKASAHKELHAKIINLFLTLLV